MTGNDIVDIHLAAKETNWQRKGFLEKIFTPSEQSLINNTAAPQQMVWRLWTMKESAYKLYTRQQGGRFFAPGKHHCSINSGSCGEVSINDQQYQTLTSTTSNYIYTIAKPVNDKTGDFINSCFDLPDITSEEQRAFLYNKILIEYNRHSNMKNNALVFTKDGNGIPWLSCKNESTKIPVSITHHGRFAAFTIN